jgi:hypothetical protein
MLGEAFKDPVVYAGGKAHIANRRFRHPLTNGAGCSAEHLGPGGRLREATVVRRRHRPGHHLRVCWTELKPHSFTKHCADEAADAVRLPSGSLRDFVESGTIGPFEKAP